MPPSRNSFPSSSSHRRKSAPSGLKIATRESLPVTPTRPKPPTPVTPPRPRQLQPYENECKRLKIPKLHSMQKAIIDSIVARPLKDQFVVAATGSGKSILFELPAILSGAEGKITIVFIPRIAIIRLELERLTSCGITAQARYGKKHNPTELEAQNKLLFEGLDNPDALPRFLLVTPHQLEHTETTLQTLLIGLYERRLIHRFVFDEIHMLLDKAQLIVYLCTLRSKFPSVPLTVLSASLSPATANELKGLLNINSRPKVFPLDRPNLYYWVMSKYSSGELGREKGDQNTPKKKDTSQLAMILRLANNTYPKGAGLVYCRMKDACKRMAGMLTSAGVPAEYYDAERGETGEGYEVLSKWIQNDPTVRVIVSTVALSSGVHKPDGTFGLWYTRVFPHPEWMRICKKLVAQAETVEKRPAFYAMYAFDDAFKVSQDTQYETENIYALLRFIHSSECRRRMLLSYYGDEHYRYDVRKSRCCDVCDNKSAYSQLDITPVARRVLQSYSNFEQKNGPIGGQALAEKLQKTIGANQKTTVETWKKIVQWLIIERYLEKDKPGGRGGGQIKVIRGPRLNNILRGGVDKIWLPWSMQFHEYWLGKSSKHWPRLWTEEMVNRMTEIEVADSSRSVSPEL